MRQRWKKIPGFDGTYQARRDGQFRRLSFTTARGYSYPMRTLKQHMNGGELVVTLSPEPGVQARFSVRELLLKTFGPEVVEPKTTQILAEPPQIAHSIAAVGVNPDEVAGAVAKLLKAGQPLRSVTFNFA